MRIRVRIAHDVVVVELEGEEPRGAQTREGGRKSAGIRGGLSKECRWEYHVRVNRALGHVSFGYA
jgi:hypothetical protein